MAFGITDKEGGDTRLQVEAIEEYLLGMYAENQTERDVGIRESGDTSLSSELERVMDNG